MTKIWDTGVRVYVKRTILNAVERVLTQIVFLNVGELSQIAHLVGRKIYIEMFHLYLKIAHVLNIAQMVVMVVRIQYAFVA